jgi:hypothetical protein
MLIRPWLEVTTTVEGRLGRMLMKAGVEENGIGGRGRIVRKSYTLTSGSGNGRDCLNFECQSASETERILKHLTPSPIVKTKLPVVCRPCMPL